MQIARVIVPRHAPENSGTVSRMIAVSLPAPPWELDIDPHRRDTAPRGAVTRLPARKARVAVVELGVMDMGAVG